MTISKAMPSFIVAGDDEVILLVHVVPGSKRSGVVGVHGEKLKVAVREIASDGAANAGVLRVIAEALDVAKSKVSLRSGHTQRGKRIAVHGISAALVAEKMTHHLSLKSVE